MSEEAPPEEEDPFAAVASARELPVSNEDSKREEGAASVEKLPRRAAPSAALSASSSRGTSDFKGYERRQS